MNIITEAKNDGLKTNVDGIEITPDNVESLLNGIASGKINYKKINAQQITNHFSLIKSWK